jgi:hypothetical protein
MMSMGPVEKTGSLAPLAKLSAWAVLLRVRGALTTGTLSKRVLAGKGVA